MGEVIAFEAGNVPAHIAARFGDALANNDLSAGVSAGFPMISYKGKVWHLVQGGSRTLITNDDGEPRQSIEVVILKANPAVSKVYYAEGYVEGSDEKPTCFSHDGIAPMAESTVLQSAKCAICPRNQWGSRITESGAKGKECADSRRLAVAPSGDLENPMLLRVPAGSLKELMIFADSLNRLRAPYQAVSTKISFDHTVAHPKMLFKAVRWLEEAEVEQVAEVMQGPVVQAIIGEAGEAVSGAIEHEDETIAGTRPSNAATVEEPVKGRASKPRPVAAAQVAAALAEPEEVIEAEVVEAEPVAPVSVTKGFGGSGGKAAAVAPVPATARATAAPKQSKLLDDASASLDDVLAALDD